jgi:hypothetical protein
VDFDWENGLICQARAPSPHLGNLKLPLAPARHPAAAAECPLLLRRYG